MKGERCRAGSSLVCEEHQRGQGLTSSKMAYNLRQESMYQLQNLHMKLKIRKENVVLNFLTTTLPCRICLALYILLINYGCKAYNVTNVPIDSTIEWSSERPLKWSDFQSKKIVDSVFYAYTSTEVHYKWASLDGKWNFTIRAFFIPYKSWSRTEIDTMLLKHEQVHFDITELVARRMRAYINDLEVTDRNLDSALSVLHKIFKQRNELSEQYDSETMHGTKANTQQKWNEWVAKQLAELKEYQLLPKVVPNGGRKKKR
jgi:hypothetical protein